MPEESIEGLKKIIVAKDMAIKILEEKLSSFEGNGIGKMYYSMNRQMSDLADMMNSKNLKSANLEDKDDKTLERMKIIWGAVKSISEILPVLKQAGGLTGDEQEDLRKPFIESVAQKRQ